MNRLSSLLCLLWALLLVSPSVGLAAGQTAEEQYDREIRSLIVVADRHLSEATEALVRCLGNFSSCVADPSPTVRSLNASRNGLIAIRGNVLSLEVPDRYRTVNFLVLQGLNDSIEGLALQIEGLEEADTATFRAGSDHLSVGRGELKEAVELLNATPPRSSLFDLLLILLLALGASIALSVALIFWWYRREKRARGVPQEDEP